MKIELNRINKDFNFQGIGSTNVDGSPEIGEKDAGFDHRRFC